MNITGNNLKRRMFRWNSDGFENPEPVKEEVLITEEEKQRKRVNKPERNKGFLGQVQRRHH